MHHELNDAFNMYKESDAYLLSLTYRGPFIGDLTSHIVDISENTIVNNQGLPMVNRKVSFLLVECFQNIVKHGEMLENSILDMSDYGMFNFKTIESAYIINSINLIKSEQVTALKETVEYINSLDRHSLKDLYKKNLLENKISSKGGAGLGLIEMARKSGQKLVYEFEDIDGEYAFFHQQITFIMDDTKALDQINFVEDTRKLYHEMEKQNVLLQYKGDFSQKSIVPMIDIVERNLIENGSRIRTSRRAAHVLIEILQNVSKHAEIKNHTKEGIFRIGQHDNNIFVEVGNEILNERTRQFEAWLNHLSGMSRSELKAMHRVRILGSLDKEDKSSAGLGMIEIAKAISKPWRFKFHEMDSKKAFFLLQVSV